MRFFFSRNVSLRFHEKKINLIISQKISHYEHISQKISHDDEISHKISHDYEISHKISHDD